MKYIYLKNVGYSQVIADIKKWTIKFNKKEYLDIIQMLPAALKELKTLKFNTLDGSRILDNEVIQAYSNSADYSPYDNIDEVIYRELIHELYCTCSRLLWLKDNRS